MAERERARKRRLGAAGVSADQPGDAKEESGLRKLLAEIQKIALPLLISGGGLFGFVTFVGGALTWARFETAKLPSEQAVSAMEEGELIARGAVAITLFAILGVLAVIATYLISEKGRATKGMAYGLFVLVIVESIVVVVEAHDETAQTVGATLALAVAAVAGVAVLELLGPSDVAVGAWVRNRARGAGSAIERALGEPRSPAAWIAAIFWWPGSSGGSNFWRGVDIARRIVLIPFRPLMLVLWALLKAAASVIRPLVKWSVQKPQRPNGGAEPEPFRVRPLGYVICLLVGAAVAVAAAESTEEWWVAASLALAGVLGFGCFQVAAATQGFRWYGVAVFFSVATFGAVFSVFQALDEPQIQPIALVREGDRPGEGLQGIFVTENDDRVYLATVARNTCGSKKLVADSGRLFWVPREDVVAYAIGPQQNADRAARSAPAMLATLSATRIDKNGRQGPEDLSRAAARALTVTPPIRTFTTRYEIQKPSSRRARVGEKVTLTGRGFGRHPGTVTVGGVPAPVVSWGDKHGHAARKVVFTVPPGAKTGQVLVGCHVRRPPPILEVERSRRKKRP